MYHLHKTHALYNNKSGCNKLRLKSRLLQPLLLFSIKCTAYSMIYKSKGLILSTLNRQKAPQLCEAFKGNPKLLQFGCAIRTTSCIDMNLCFTEWAFFMRWSHFFLFFHFIHQTGNATNKHEYYKGKN